MRALLTSLTLISAISLSSAAFAASTATGTVRAFDAKAQTLTLKDGTSYMLPASFKDPGIKVGEKVKVAYEMIGKKHQATAVTLAQ
ncbi:MULTISPECIES: DUF1344 domain-containing protein [unclassified Rhizobium]|uniref:DUF1344 domain-containing protein n=1 Tax=unclassified Rhizobium TaxID=2613769 RepID=UPI0007138941|nr:MULTISPECIES: DUF1344 domain-containing protein [unclassified Rhizobium]KQS96364.1 hypothetical protein ASG50_04700 [Rhizobium sp. Leaf386]KQT06203.1 hypothetical protein ASG42_00945 [Rhizobium sp. Leaf391]KQU09562.1 hypothetical protein ASG68_00675 [Rhizobium sp. Leaf453]